MGDDRWRMPNYLLRSSQKKIVKIGIDIFGKAIFGERQTLDDFGHISIDKYMETISNPYTTLADTTEYTTGEDVLTAMTKYIKDNF